MDRSFIPGLPGLVAIRLIIGAASVPCLHLSLIPVGAWLPWVYYEPSGVGRPPQRCLPDGAVLVLGDGRLGEAVRRLPGQHGQASAVHCSSSSTLASAVFTLGSSHLPPAGRTMTTVPRLVGFIR